MGMSAAYWEDMHKAACAQLKEEWAHIRELRAEKRELRVEKYAWEREAQKLLAALEEAVDVLVGCNPRRVCIAEEVMRQALEKTLATECGLRAEDWESDQ